MLKSIADKYDGIKEVLNSRETQLIITHLLWYSASIEHSLLSEKIQSPSMQDAGPSFAYFFLIPDRLDQAETLTRKAFKSSSESLADNNLNHVLEKM